MRRIAFVTVAAIAFAAAALGIPVHALDTAHAGVDEPQYLFTALALGDGHGVNIAPELAAERWRAFADVPPPVQTAVLSGNRQVSPHDPLLPLLIALPVHRWGWIAAKWTLAVLAALLAAALLELALRLDVPLPLAAPGVALAAATAPLSVYGQQIYPELPAALAVTVAAIALTGPPRTRGAVAAALAVLALPWLSVKYAPVAATIAVLVLWRLRSTRTAWYVAGFWVAGGAAYFAIHKAIWGGWTVYASGDEFARSGEFGAVGFHPDYPGRTIRLIGLLVDRGFGLASWQPAYLLLVPALAWLLTARPAHWPVLAAPLAVGWLNATYVALTMHGYWWPGRQLVVVLPLAVAVILRWLAVLTRRTRLAAGALALSGVAIYVKLLVSGWRKETSWVHAPDDPSLHPLIQWLLPDDRVLATPDRIRLALWLAATALAVLLVVRGNHRVARAK